MKKIIVISYVLFVVAMYGDIKVVSIQGVVQTKKNLSQSWVKVAAGDMLTAGNFIFTGFNSNAILEYNTIKIEVKPLSQLQISSLFSDSNKTISDVYLKYGQIKADVKRIDTVKTDFKVRSANTTASVRGTGFTFGNDVLLVEHGTVLYQDTLFNNALAQSGEQYQYAKYLYSIVENIETLVAGYELTAKPLGLADSDDLPEGYVAGTGNAGGAQLIIKITVTK
ncbi:MAG: hypothetical protein A2015_00290 [Spirochaetes bacterium GWF1_31_7]|nr:MAG: hypothetical protein A2Y30_04220 [Spirochaetes bacterium GWE1_32_154]OHD45980.1 MAG: hypothetical protein A2Y29_07760 [Spirochaetes bacterium GWE2_31_10]OHD51027.1 MAG: hypothetical protein A2015_00290 [Spirochaetes bacterium GWF1_31_7]OHD83200.1 MAG: hypothetical protein A2355_02290 [Spirochaetes bacterium RIFOXYB1_FULL_32_8]HBD94344.1 hypothetical protein [Spirochaetia bacterium]